MAMYPQITSCQNGDKTSQQNACPCNEMMSNPRVYNEHNSHRPKSLHVTKANDIIVTNLMSYLKGSNVHVFANHYMSLK